nr:unnamed protein product [Spirometra erinaceieuropaei]
MKIDDKFFKEMFLERLPTSVQTILASGSDDLEISKLAEMADHSNGIQPLPSKVAAIRDFPSPTSKRQLQRFLGMVNFYRRFFPNCADTILPLTSLLSGSKCTFELTTAALTSFAQVKALLADATLLTRFHADAPMSLMVDAWTVAVGVVLQQHLAGSTQPLAFFSKKLLPAETRYSTFGPFGHFLEGRDFTNFTDHKPLTFALRSHTDKLNPREIRQLDYISQFTSDIRHIDGSRNEVADALSRPSIAHLQLSPGIDLAEMAAEQRRVGSPCDEDVSGLQLQELPLTTGNGTILCDVSTSSHRPFVPPSPRRKVFSSLHNLSHPGSRATDKLVSDRFVWPGMHKDLKAWTRACISVNGPDLDCSAAELVFGSTVRLPGEMISPTPQGAVEDPTNLLHRIRQFMRTLSPVPPRSSASPSYLEKDLATCSHVYLRCGQVRRPLEPPYDGPFRVLSRGPKTFRIQRDNREEVVSVDRLKAAVPDIPPDEPCGPQPSVSPMQPLFHRPVFTLCPPVRHLRLPPPTPTLPPPDLFTLLRTLYISLAVVVMYTFLIGRSRISFRPVHILRRRFRRPPVSEGGTVPRRQTVLPFPTCSSFLNLLVF